MQSVQAYDVDFNSQKLLIKNLVNNPDLARVYLAVCKEVDVFTALLPKLVFYTTSEFYDDFACLPKNDEIFKNLLIKNMQEVEGAQAIPLSDVLASIDWMFDGNDLHYDWSKDCFQRLVQYSLDVSIQSAMASKDVLQVKNAIHRSKQLEQLNNSRGGAVRESLYGTTDEEITGNCVSAVKIPTNVDWLDEILGGGSFPGELMGFIIPSSGGKTSLGIQLDNCYVSHSRNIAYMSFEQRTGGDLSLRNRVISTDSTRTAWKDLDHVAPELIDRFKKMQKLGAKHSRFYYMLTEGTKHSTVEDMLTLLREDIAGGWVPELIVFDWLGLAAKNMVIANGGNTADAGDMKDANATIIQGLKRFGESIGASIALFHQMGGGSISEKSSSAYDASGDKELPFQMDVCFSATKPSTPGNIFKMTNDKTRSAGRAQIELFLDGERCKIVKKPTFTADIATTVMQEEALSIEVPDDVDVGSLPQISTATLFGG